MPTELSRVGEGYEMKVKLRVFLTPELDGSEWSADRPGRYNLMDRAPGAYVSRTVAARPAYELQPEIPRPSEQVYLSCPPHCLVRQ
jgi:hypothetical protein